MSIYEDYEFAFDLPVTDITGNKHTLAVCADRNSYDEIDEVIAFDDQLNVVPVSPVEYDRLEKRIIDYFRDKDAEEASAYQGYMENVRYDEYKDRQYLNSYAR